MWHKSINLLIITVFRLSIYVILEGQWLMISARNEMLIIIIISFMQGIYTYIPETNYVPRE